MQEIALPELKAFNVGLDMCGWAYLESFCGFFGWTGWDLAIKSLADVPIEEDTAFGAISRIRQMSPLRLAPHRKAKLEATLTKLYGTGDDEHQIAAYASWAVALSRSREASDLRDKVFAPLGLADRYLDQKARSVPLPDYSKSVVRVYTRFATYVISATRGLTILAQVQTSNKPRNQALPSWVPHFSADGYDPYDSFMMRNQYHPCIEEQCASFVFVDERRLLLRGYRLSSVNQLLPADTHSDAFDVLSLFRLAKTTTRMGAGSDWLECYLHTTTASSLEEVTTESLRSAFLHALTLLILVSKPVISGVRDRHEYADDVLLLCAGSSYFPGRQELHESITASTQVISSIGSKDLASIRSHDGLHELKSQALLYIKPFEDICGHRNLITTADGDLGLTPDICAQGDHIWLFPGSKAPIVLRSLADGKVMVIGEAYVHGCMCGEVFRQGCLSRGDMREMTLD